MRCALHTDRALTDHSRVHANVHPHLSAMCNEGFTTQSAIKLNFMIHTGDKI